MGLRDFINTQTIKAQNKQSDFMARNMALILESTMKKKVERLRKEKRPINVENLVSGWEALEKVGLTKEDVVRVAEQYVALNEMGDNTLEEKVKVAKKYLKLVPHAEARERLYENIKKEFAEIKSVDGRQKLFNDYTGCPAFMALWEKYQLKYMHLKKFVDGD